MPKTLFIFAKNNVFCAMQLVFIILTLIALLIVVVAIVIMLGRGDDFIAGYNIASNKSRDMYHTKRLRIVIGVLLMLIAAALPIFAALLILGHTAAVMIAFPALAFILIAGTFTVTHFWVKKRDKKSDSSKK